MKALDGYFLMVVFMLLLNKLQFFSNFDLNRETLAMKGLKRNTNTV